jgi:hypothetical protein
MRFHCGVGTCPRRISQAQGSSFNNQHQQYIAKRYLKEQNSAMDKSVTGPSAPTLTRPRCSHCDKPGHNEEKCWVKHPDLKALYIEKRYGKKTKIGKAREDEVSAHAGEPPSFDVPIRTVGTSGTQQAATVKPEKKGTPPRVAPKSKRTTDSQKKRPIVKRPKGEMAYFGPVQGKSSVLIAVMIA